MRLHPGQYPGLRLRDRHLADLLRARQNLLLKYRLARACLYYAPDKEAVLTELVREVVLDDDLRGTALERQSLADLVALVEELAAARPGVYSVQLVNSVGHVFGTIVSESVPTATVGATGPSAPSPTAPLRIVLAGAASAVQRVATETARSTTDLWWGRASEALRSVRSEVRAGARALVLRAERAEREEERVRSRSPFGRR